MLRADTRLRKFPERTLVTGATGFLGRALVQSMLADGATAEHLSCLVRRPDRAAESGLPPAAILEGGLDSAATLERAVAGVEVIVHLAGATRVLSRREFDRVNHAGTARLVAAAVATRVPPRLVFVSSLAAAGPSADGAGTDRPPSACAPASAYGESKRRAEIAVAAAPLRWIVLRPPVVYGPADAATRLLMRQACRAVVPVPRRARPLSIAHVDDVVRALRLAMVSAANGLFLPLDGAERTETDELMRVIARAHGRTARLVGVPLGIVRAAAHCADAWSRLSRRPSFFSVDKVRDIAATGWVADPEPARRVLGFDAAIGLERGWRELAGRARDAD